MANATHITQILIEEGIKARAHFQVWWILRNRALPKYYKAMSNYTYVDYFHAANSGHYTLFLLSLAKLFDRDPRVAGVRELKRLLRSEGNTPSALSITRALKPHEATIRSVMAIRNGSIVHNEHSIARQRTYEINGVTVNDLRALIDAACKSINMIAADLGITNRIFDSDRTEQATLNMLETLARGAKVSQQ